MNKYKILDNINNMKKILFTGARSGIAKNVIDKLIKLNKYYIYITVHTEKEETCIKNIYNNTKNITCFKLDITKKEDRNKVINLNIDILVCNAAIGISGSLIEIPIYKVKENFNVNVFSNLELIQLTLKNMLKNQNGKIIIISSLAGIIPIEFLGSYCATKASIIMLAKVLQKELKIVNPNIKIKIIEPGIYKTGFNEIMIDNKNIDNSKYFKSKKNDIEIKDYIMFDFLAHKKLNSISKQIIKAIQKDNNKLIYKAPFFQSIFSKIYQIFKS